MLRDLCGLGGFYVYMYGLHRDYRKGLYRGSGIPHHKLIQGLHILLPGTPGLRKIAYHW